MSRVGAIAILVALIALPSLLVISATVAYRRSRMVIAEKQQTLLELQAIADQASDVERWANSVAEAPEAGGLLLTGDSAALIAAELQSRLVGLASQAGAQVTSFRTLDPAPDGDFVDIAVELEGQAPITAIRALLQRLEYDRPLLAVRSAQLRAAQPGLPMQGEPVLGFRLQGHGLWRPQAKAVDESAS